jgi:hypothetical protein
MGIWIFMLLVIMALLSWRIEKLSDKVMALRDIVIEFSAKPKEEKQ